MFVDSDHAGDKVFCWSRSCLLMHINTALVKCFSKKQSTVETSAFSNEFFAMKQGKDALRGLRYNLRMMSVAISGPSYIDGDNMYIVYNTSKPESVLRKKSNSVCYHTVCESASMGESLVRYIPSKKMFHI